MTRSVNFPNNISPPDSDVTDLRSQSFEVFKQTIFKVAIQKKGELTKISFKILNDAFKLHKNESLKDYNDRALFALNDDWLGILFVRNNDLCRLVSGSSTDAAIVGLDQVYEYNYYKNFDVIREFPELGTWDIVLATPKVSNYKNLYDLKLVATEYPTITQKFFKQFGHTKVEIIQTRGCTEVYPLLKYNGNQIDGIIQIRATGNTLKANGMQAWNPPIMKIKPVLIANKKSLLSKSKKRFFTKLKGTKL